MQPINLLHYCTIALSLTTAAGVFVHDTKLDQATTTALARPAEQASDDSASSAKIANMPHTHSERGSLYQAVKDIKNSNPRIHPRQSDKELSLTKKVSKGVHVFDGYYMPLGEL